MRFCHSPLGKIGRCLLLAVMLQELCAEAADKSPAPETRQTTLDLHGGLVDPPLPKPDFVLTDTAGKPFPFRDRTQGYVTLLFFGFAHCADICPTHLATLARSMRKLPVGTARRLKVVFVTTDPKRDTPQSLRKWHDHFDHRFIGLTGNEAQVTAAQAAAQVPQSKRAGADVIDHAAFIIAYSRDNLGRVIYPAGVTEDDWRHDLPVLERVQ